MSTPSPTAPTAAPGSTSTSGPGPDPTGRAPQLILSEIAACLDELRGLATPAPAAPGLHLSPADCNALEETTGLGTTRSVGDLLRAIERLATISVGDIRIPFTPGQLAELKHRASKRGRTLAEEMKAVVQRIEDELFYKGG